MSWKNNKELKIGIFVIVVLGTTFLAINYLRSIDIFNKEYEIKAYYEDANGLLPSAAVMYKGYKIGQVSTIVYDNSTGLFTVTCSVSKEFTIPEDSDLIIIGMDVMGTKGMKIVPGSSPVACADGAVLCGKTESDMLSSLTGSITSLAGKLENTLDSLDLVVSNANEILGEKNKSAVANMLSDLEKTMANIEEISSALGGKSGEFSDFASNLNSISAQIDSILSVAGTAVSDISEVTAAIDPEEISGLISSIKSLTEKIQDPDGSLGKLMHEDSLYRSLDSLLYDVDDLVKKIRENPKKYIKISVF